MKPNPLEQPARTAGRTLAMRCDGLGLQPNQEESWLRRMISALRGAVRERAGINLGARVAIRGLYLALLEHYSGEGLFLLPGPCAERSLRSEVSRLLERGKTGPKTKIADVRGLSRVADQHRLHWFEPRCIEAELLDVRQAYFRRPFPVTWTHHTISYRHSLGEIFLPLLFADSLPCDSIICSSRAARTAISNILEMIESRLPIQGQTYKGRLDVVPFGVNTDEFRPIEQRGCRHVFGLPLDATIFLCLGRISASDKGDLLPLAMAVGQVQQQLRNQRVLLVVAGNARGTYSDHLKREVRERGLGDLVRFVPYVAETEKPYLYGAADIFVSPSESIQECFGLVILEAMACGIPQVVSDWNGYRDLVAHEETGFLIPTMWAECDDAIIGKGTAYPQEWELEHFQLGQSACVDLRALSNALVMLTRNQELRLRMSAASRQRAQAMFGWKHIVHRYEELWTELDDIASRLPDLQHSSNSYRVPSYFRCFQHYSTTNLNENYWLTWDKSGAAGSRDIVLPYRNLFQGYEPYAEWNLSEIRRVLELAGRPMRVGDVLDRAASDCERGDTLRQVMWLLKYGYLRAMRDVEQEAPTGDFNQSLERVALEQSANTAGWRSLVGREG